MSPVSQILCDKAPAPIAPYSHATKAGGFVFVSGVVGSTSDGKLIAGYEDPVVEARQVLTNLKNVLESAGSSIDKVTKTTIFVTDLSKYAGFNTAYAEFFNESTVKPARSCVQVTKLPLAEASIEIELIALA